MTTIGRRLFVIMLAGVCLISGCQKLNYEKTLKLSDTDVRAISIDGPRREQKVAVTVTAPGAKVDVYVVPEKDQEAVTQDLLNHKKPKEVLASKQKVESDTLEVTIPAKMSFSVVLGAASKDCEVKVSVKGR